MESQATKARKTIEVLCVLNGDKPFIHFAGEVNFVTRCQEFNNLIGVHLEFGLHRAL